MNYRWFVILACIFVTACDSSTKEPTKKDADNKATATTPAKTNPAAELAAEYKVAFDEFMKKVQSAQRLERAEIMKSNPAPEFAEQFRTLAAENADSEIEATALGWLANNSDQPEEKAQALATLMEKYRDSPVMKDASVAIVASGKPSQQAEDNLRSIMKNSPHREARGAAAYELVTYLDRYKMYVDSIDELAENERFVAAMGEEGIDYLRNLKVNDAEMEKLYDSIVKEYPDVVINQFGRDTVIGEAAGSALFEIRNLSMGCVAPDIEGSDLDGEEFALSDYRGKVVMLDFWGHW
jgi:hypothetical protein